MLFSAFMFTRLKAEMIWLNSLLSSTRIKKINSANFSAVLYSVILLCYIK